MHKETCKNVYFSMHWHDMQYALAALTRKSGLLKCRNEEFSDVASSASV